MPISRSAAIPPPPPGTRVRHGATSVVGLVAGKPEPFKRTYLLPVTIEGTTRTELWPAGLIEPLPKAQQLIAMGGKVQPPKGYPLTKIPTP